MRAAAAYAVFTAGLTKHYGDVAAVEDLDLAVPAGTVLAVLGPRGAGKTTVVRVLATLTRPDAGTAAVGGYDVVPHARTVRTLIGLSGHPAALDGELTGRENLELLARLHHLRSRRAARRAAELLKGFGLAPVADRPTHTYSEAMRRRLDMATSLVAWPPVLLLDEPTAGLDRRNRMALWKVIRSLRGGGTTIVLTTESLEEAERLADRVVVLGAGRAIAEGTPEELRDKIGGEVLDVVVTDHRRLDKAGLLLARIGSGDVVPDRAANRLQVPVGDGPAALVEAVRALDGAGIRIADITLRRPVLDDAFLALTGRTADGASGAER